MEDTTNISGEERRGRLPQPAVGGSLPPDIARRILEVRDALAKGDQEEAYHWLYSIASPGFDKTDPWADLERDAGRRQ